MVVAAAASTAAITVVAGTVVVKAVDLMGHIFVFQVSDEGNIVAVVAVLF